MDNISNSGNSINSYQMQGQGRRNAGCCSSNFQQSQRLDLQQNQGQGTGSQSQSAQQIMPLIMSLLEQLKSGNSGSDPLETASTNPSSDPFNTDSSSAGLSTQAADTLIYSREEEKLARDVYSTLFDQWDNQSFSNISSSEQRHMDRLGNELENYGLNDPITDNTVGAFNNTDLSHLYQDLVDRGSTSELDALYVGAYIEELDIMDLQKAVAESGNSDLNTTYEKLLDGSYNHLRSFVGQIENQGIAYEAQLMPQNEVDEITSTAMERGGGRGMGGQMGGQGRRFS